MHSENITLKHTIGHLEVGLDKEGTAKASVYCQFEEATRAQVWCVAACCSVLQCVAVCCSVL